MKNHEIRMLIHKKLDLEGKIRSLKKQIQMVEVEILVAKRLESSANAPPVSKELCPKCDGGIIHHGTTFHEECQDCKGTGFVRGNGFL